MKYRTLPFAIFLLLAIKFSHEISLDNIDDYWDLTKDPEINVKKRDTTPTKSISQDFFEEKLIEHSQALEHLMKIAQHNEELTKQLVENLGKHIEKPQLPEKIEVVHVNRRNNRPFEKFGKSTDNPLVTIGKMIPAYGLLAGNLLMTNIVKGTEPIPVVERKGRGPNTNQPEFTRRSNSVDSSVSRPQNAGNHNSPWCSVAVLCHKSNNSICGFDDTFGYGKFDDVCHMLQVNCYWKYNFALVPSCKPS